MSMKKMIISCFLVVFLIECKLSEVTQTSDLVDKGSSLFELLVENKATSSKSFSPNEEDFLLNVGVEQVKKKDNIVISSDVMPSSISLKIDKDYFKAKGIGLSVVKNSVRIDDKNGNFSYKVRLEKNKLYKILTISYSGLRKTTSSLTSLPPVTVPTTYDYIFSGDNISFIIDNKGTLYGAGSTPTLNNQLGARLINGNNFTPIKYKNMGVAGNAKKVSYCRRFPTIFIITNDNFYAYSQAKNRFNGFDVKVKEIVCSAGHILIVTETNALMTMGTNKKGQLGLGDIIDRPNDPAPVTVPNLLTSKSAKIQASKDHSFVVTTDNDLYAFGSNVDGYGDLGVLGLGNVTFTSTPTKITTVNVEGKVGQVSTHYNHSLVVTTDNNLFAAGACSAFGARICGFNFVSNSFIEIASMRGRVKKVFASQNGTFVITTGNRLMAVGQNSHQELGLPEKKSYNDFTSVSLPVGVKVKHLSIGLSHVMLITKNNKVYGLGSNDEGELGLGHSNKIGLFTEVTIP